MAKEVTLEQIKVAHTRAAEKISALKVKFSKEARVSTQRKVFTPKAGH